MGQLPRGSLHPEPQVGHHRPSPREGHHHRPLLPGPRREAAGVRCAHPGAQHDDVDGIDQRGHHRRRRHLAGRGAAGGRPPDTRPDDVDDEQPLQPHAELDGGRQAQGRHADRRHPAPVGGRSRHQRHGQGGGTGTGLDRDRGSPPQAIGQQRQQAGQHGQRPLPGQRHRAGPLGDTGQRGPRRRDRDRGGGDRQVRAAQVRAARDRQPPPVPWPGIYPNTCSVCPATRPQDQDGAGAVPVSSSSVGGSTPGT